MHTMKRALPWNEQVDVSSSSSSSSSDSDVELGLGSAAKQSTNSITIDRPAQEVIPEDVVLRRAEMYQDYMRHIPIPTQRGSVIPCTTWLGLASSVKQLYGQPLHYLTNILLRQWDQLRIGAADEHKPLDTIIHPCKAEANIWLIEEVHRQTSSHHQIAKLWLSDPFHHAFVDPIFPQLGDA